MPYRFPCPDCRLEFLTVERKGAIARCPNCARETRVPKTAEHVADPTGAVARRPVSTSCLERGLFTLIELAGISAAALLGPPAWVVLLIVAAMIGFAILFVRNETRRRRRPVD